MSQSLSALYLSNPELANALRRQQEGRALMQQGMDSSPIQSPWQGISRLAQALVGGYQEGQAEREFKEQGARSKAEMGDFMGLLGQAMMGGRSQPAAASAPASGTAPAAATPAAMPAIPANLSDDDLLVRTVYGEARGETPIGQQAVAAVARNRARAAGQSLRDVLLAPNQFEPWNNPQTRAQLLSLDTNSPEYQSIAQSVLGTTNDPTGGATHFYSPKAQEALGRPAPAWATGQGMDIGNHRFYNLPYAPRGGAPQGGDTIPVAAVGGGQGAPQAPQQAAGMDPRMMQALALQAAQSSNPRIQAMAPMLMQMAKGEDTTKILPPGGELRSNSGGLIARNTTVSPNTVLTNDMRGPGAYDQKIGGELADEALAWRKRGESAYGEIRNLDRMMAALDQFKTGAGSETAITLGQLANRLNVPAATLQALGLDAKTIAQGEQIRAIGNQLVMSALGNREFPANNFSDADRKFLTAVYPGLANSNEGNRVMIAVQKAGAQRNIEIADAWRQWRSKNGSGLESAQKFADEMLPGILSKDILVPAARDSGWMESPAAGPGGAAQPGGVAEGATATNPQTGQKLIFRNGQWEAAR